MNKNVINKYDFSNIIEDPKKRLVLIIYDIIDTKRRNKMVKLLESYGMRVQKSAFETLLKKEEFEKIVRDIQKIITEEDDVRLYKLNSSNEVVFFGIDKTMYEEDLIII